MTGVDYGAQLLRLARPGELSAAAALWIMLSYFDESYDSGWSPEAEVAAARRPSDIFAIGGFVASEADCDQIRRQWKVTKCRFGLDAPFHATDCESGWGDFRGWSQAKRDAIRAALLDVLLPRMRLGVAMSVRRSDYETIVLPRLLSSDDSMPSDPYLFCVQSTLEYVAGNTELLRLSRGERISCMFEKSPKRTGTTQRRYASLFIEFPKWGFADVLTSAPHFALKSEVPELEAADFIAYESFREASAFASLSPLPEAEHYTPSRLWTKRFKECGKVVGGLHSAETLVPLVTKMLDRRATAMARNGVVQA